MPPEKPPMVEVEREICVLADHYIELVRELHRLKGEAEGIDDRLPYVLDAVVATKRFLDTDLAVFNSGLTSILGELALALRDIQAGLHPPLLKPPTNASQRLPGRSFDALKATAAAGVELLHRADFSLDEASKFVFKAITSAVSVPARGRRVFSARMIKGWRDEVGVRSSDTATAIYRQIVADATARLGEKPTAAAAQSFVRGSALALLAEGFRAPRAKSAVGARRNRK